MTATPVSRSGPFAYASEDFISDERFVSSSTPLENLTLTHLFGYSESGDDLYVLVFGETPNAGDVPQLSFKVPAGQTFSYGPPAPDGWQFQRATGIDPVEVCWFLSTTGNELTITTETAWVNAQGAVTVGV